MKKVIIILLFIFSLLNISYPIEAISNIESFASTTMVTDDFASYSKVTINDLEDSLISSELSGNVDIDYLTQIITQYTREVRFSVLIQGFTENEKILSFANDVLASQTAKLREMRPYRHSLLKDYKLNSESDTPYIQAIRKIYQNMFDSLNNYTQTDNPDNDYLNYILIVNSSAIEICETSLKYLQNDATKKIAENIISTKTAQNQTIKLLFKA